MKKFKQPLTINQQILHLETNKNVNFMYTTKSDAYDCLLKFNYINIITPYKYYYAKKNNNAQALKDINGNHIYEKNVDFSKYVNRHYNERNKYVKIYSRLSEFETIFNAILSYSTIIHYDLSTESQIERFIHKISENTKAYSKNINLNKRLLLTINELELTIKSIGSVFIAFDRLSLNNLRNIFHALDKPLKVQIFHHLKHYGQNLSFIDLPTFEENLHRLVGIRNTVYHNNSLEILIRYYNFKTGEYQKSSDQRKYKSLIKKLCL